MPESIADLLARFRRQGYQFLLTDDQKIRAIPPSGSLPEHVRSQVSARRTEIVEHLIEEAWTAARDDYRLAVFEMAALYEARRPYARFWVEGRSLNVLWEAHRPTKEDYDTRNVPALRLAAQELRAAVVEWASSFDAQTEHAPERVVDPSTILCTTPRFGFTQGREG